MSDLLGFSASHTGFPSLDTKLVGIDVRASRPRALLNALADSLERKARTAFSREGPGWAPLKPATNRDRVRKRYPPAHPILERTGDLRRSASEAGSAHIRRYVAGTKGIEVGSRDAKAVFHQKGTSRMVARPFYRITSVELTTWRIMAGNHIMGRPIT